VSAHGFYALYLSLFPAALLGMAYAHNTRGRGGSLPPRPTGQIDHATWNLLGYANLDRTSHFDRFSTVKGPGTIRIGCFGDSFTHGDEVDDGFDFPALLGRQLRAHGHPNVEVLNFGMPWHGFHQSYIIWERLARAYGLDYVLLGPGSFQPDRDTTFDHTQGFAPYYLHARYVLSGDGVRLVPVIGDGYADRRQHLDRLVPHWQYLRYDRRAPALLRSILPLGREMSNPFYYYAGSARDEAYATYRVLLAQMANDRPATQIILATPSDDLRLGAAVERPNLASWSLDRPLSFPYRMAKDHNSPLGNALVARQYRDILESVRGTEEVLRVADLSIPDVPAASAAALPGHFRDARVELAGLSVGAFSHPGRRGGLDGGALQALEAPLLVALKAAGDSVLDACFVPAPFPLGTDSTVALVANGSRRSLGAMRLLSPEVAIGVVDLPATRLRCTEEEGVRIDANAEAEAPAGNLELEVGGRTLLRGRAAGRSWALAPVRGRPIVIRARGDTLLDIDRLAPSGTVFLVLTAADGRVMRLPVGQWRKEPLAPRVGTAVLHPLVALSGAAGAAMATLAR
jgi:hypothetical protein